MKLTFSLAMAIIVSVSLVVSVLLISSQVGFAQIFYFFANNNGSILQEGEARSIPYFVDVHNEPDVRAGDAALGIPYFRIYPHWMDNFGERHCEECTMIEYSPPSPQRQAAVAYQSEKLLDLSGAKRIKFFAMGDLGGEQVSFMAIGKEIDIGDVAYTKNTGIFKDKTFGVATEKVTLTDTWTRFEISLDDQDLSAVQFPFAFQLDGENGHPNGTIRLYLKNIIIDSEEPQKPIPVNGTSTN
jgi:hypothetical protein